MYNLARELKRLELMAEKVKQQAKLEYKWTGNRKAKDVMDQAHYIGEHIYNAQCALEPEE